MCAWMGVKSKYTYICVNVYVEVYIYRFVVGLIFSFSFFIVYVSSARCLVKDAVFQRPCLFLSKFKKSIRPLVMYAISAARKRERGSLNEKKNIHTSPSLYLQSIKPLTLLHRVTVDTRERPLCSYNDVIYTCRPLPYIHPYVWDDVDGDGDDDDDDAPGASNFHFITTPTNFKIARISNYLFK